MLGLLCYKPQYAVLPFLILLIGKHWKTLFWSLFFAVLTVLSSALVFGTAIWTKYIENIPVFSKLLSDDWINVSAINITMYSFVRLLSGNAHWAHIAQTIISLLAVILICLTWNRIGNHGMRCAALTAATLLTTPYALQYDIVLLAVPLAFYGWDVYERGFLRGESFMFAFMFWLPFLNYLIVHLTGIQIAPVVIIIFIAISLRRALSKNIQCCK